MEQIIGRIVDIEKNAQQTVKTAENLRLYVQQDAQKELSQIRENYTSGVNLKLKKLSQDEQIILNDQLKTLQDEHTRQISLLENISKKYHKAWVDNIFQDIISSAQL